MPLMSRNQLHRTLPSCIVEQMTAKRHSGHADSVDNHGLMVSGETKRPVGRPPHCGPRRARRNNVPLRPATGSNGEQQQQQPPPPPAISAPFAGTAPRLPSSSPSCRDTDEEPVDVVAAWSAPASAASTPSSDVQRASITLSTPSKIKSTATVVVDENLVSLLNNYNICGEVGSRPSSGGSSNSGRKRGSPQSPSTAAARTAAGGGSVVPRRSPRMTLSLDTVDLWDDSCSDLSGSSSKSTALVETAAAAVVRQTLDLGHSSPVEILTAGSGKNRLTVGGVSARRTYGVAPPSRKMFCCSHRDDVGDDGNFGSRLMQHQWHQRHGHCSGSRPMARDRLLKLPNNYVNVRRTFNDSGQAFGRIPQLVESSGRPVTACRPSTAAGSAANAVRLNFDGGAELQLYIRGLRMLGGSPSSAAVSAFDGEATQTSLRSDEGLTRLESVDRLQTSRR